MSDKPSNVIQLVTGPVGDGYHIAADEILEAAKGKLTNVVVIGWDKERDFYFAGSDGQADTNLLLDIAKQTLIGGICDED